MICERNENKFLRQNIFLIICTMGFLWKIHFNMSGTQGIQNDNGDEILKWFLCDAVLQKFLVLLRKSEW